MLQWRNFARLLAVGKPLNACEVLQIGRMREKHGFELYCANHRYRGASFILIQRTDPKRRRLSIAFVVICLLIIHHNTTIKNDLHEETLLAFVLGVLASGLFWLLIGRYNPVDKGEDIQVMGMDD